MGHEVHSRKVGKCIAIPERNGAALLDSQIEDLELSSANACKHIAHSVVVAELGVLIGEPGVAGLLRPKARLFLSKCGSV